MTYAPRMSTLDTVMAENRQLKADNAVLMQGLEQTHATSVEVLARVRKLIEMARQQKDARR